MIGRMSDPADQPDSPPPDGPPIDPPLIVFTIPGRWRDAADFAARLAAAPGGYVADGPVVRDTNTGRTYACDVRPHDPGLAHVFFISGMGRARRADALAVGNHTAVVRLTGFGGSEAAAVEMMRVATVVVAAGGIAVLVESSGVSHTKADWMKLAGDPKPGGVYWAYVILVTGKHLGFYTCGMHALGHRDVVTDVIADAQEAYAVLHQFNGYLLQSGIPIRDDDPIGNEHGALWRVRAEPCDHLPPGDLYHNPYGMWRIVRTEAFPTLS